MLNRLSETNLAYPYISIHSSFLEIESDFIQLRCCSPDNCDIHNQTLLILNVTYSLNISVHINQPGNKGGDMEITKVLVYTDISRMAPCSPVDKDKMIFSSPSASTTSETTIWPLIQQDPVTGLDYWYCVKNYDTSNYYFLQCTNSYYILDIICLIRYLTLLLI